MVHILVLEDDAKLNQIVCTYLNDCGFAAKGFLNADDAYDELYNSLYDLIISDIMMPGTDGFAFARNVRQVNEHIPILFMSARDDLPAKQKGFQLGIDDYMVKPIELDELQLRVRALLRRANIEMERKLTVGNLRLDADGMTAEIDGEEIAVTTREFNILYKLLSYPKKTFTRAQLMDEFWGVDSDASLRAVDVYITKLRDKFSPPAMGSRSKPCAGWDTRRCSNEAHTDRALRSGPDQPLPAVHFRPRAGRAVADLRRARRADHSDEYAGAERYRADPCPAGILDRHVGAGYRADCP